MPDQTTKTETVWRDYDDHGNLTQEVTTTIVTRIPEPGKPKLPLGFQPPRS